ncbi:MAG: DeoR/GlpR transcriptional regulator [Rhodobacteraceae bacterium]|nr:DeoR/GlpR transcriptional regulator [Paracoccaceae bacterium]PHR53646.1 MAG: DeoR family transcriptional regulator [Robiginitomaculum sp.]
MKHDRASDIRSFLFEHGLTPVQKLAEAVGTSLATLRRDLAVLEEKGVIERIHGAAKIAESAGIEVAFAQRETTQISAKRAIATAALPMVTPDTVIFLDSSTTVLQLARLIKLSNMTVTVFTNSLAVAHELMAAPHIEVNMLGGRTRAQNLSVIGPLAEAMLEELWFHSLFLGAGAINAALQVSSTDADEARLNAVMVRRAATTCIMADASKFDRQATYAVCDLGPQHVLITDKHPPETTGTAGKPQLIIANRKQKEDRK